MRRERIEAIRELANIKIETILEALDIDYKERYNYFTAPCPIHGGSRRDAFSFHVERGMWKCFSRGCEEDFGSDIFGLVAGLKNLRFLDAVKFVSRFVDDNLSRQEIQKLKDQRENREFVLNFRKKKKDQRIFDAAILDKLVYHPYLSHRGYPDWLINKYQIGACLQPRRYMSNRIVIPVWNLEGELVGFTGRTLDDSWKEKEIPKWKHSKGGWVSHNLFNINFAAPFIEHDGVVIVCEGPLDVLRLEQAGIHNGVAILGKKSYNEQLSLLIKCGATRLFLALDNDAAGKVGKESAIKLASCMFDVDELKIPESYKDLGEMETNEIREEFGALVGSVS